MGFVIFHFGDFVKEKKNHLFFALSGISNVTKAECLVLDKCRISLVFIGMRKFNRVLDTYY